MSRKKQTRILPTLVNKRADEEVGCMFVLPKLPLINSFEPTDDADDVHDELSNMNAKPCDR